ncbi:unnamed protein product [Amoebophrya sp. A25]|nr:unnamed protein product [Amoebophrya sp. A25]|eukprot:GSA25T00016261001.1
MISFPRCFWPTFITHAWPHMTDIEATHVLFTLLQKFSKFKRFLINSAN